MPSIDKYPLTEEEADLEENPQTEKTVYTKSPGMDFRGIAKVMTEAGYPINHHTARNVVFKTMAGFISKISGSVNFPIDSERLDTLLRNNETHEVMSDLLVKAYDKWSSQNDKQKP